MTAMPAGSPHHDHQRPAPAAVRTLADAIGGRRPYLIGAGGCGMSALGRLLAEEGLGVRGSDSTQTPVTRGLADVGIEVHTEQTASNLPEDTDVAIASAAIRPEHEQLLEAERRGLRTLTYAEALGRCMTARTGVCVAGTHGKSTTAAMLGCTLADAGLDPSVIVGATCSQLTHGAPRSRATRVAGVRVSGSARAGFRSAIREERSGQPGLLLAEVV